MTGWLKQQTPPKGPPMPPAVDQAALLAALAEKGRAGPLTPAEQYLQAHAPPGQVDKWGEPLPLSTVDQERLDRLVAILVSPYDRARELLHSGQLIHDEVEAISTGYPEIYGLLMERAWKDMIAHPPPYPAWAETTLTVLFGVPAAQVFSAGTAPQPRPPDMSSAAGKGGLVKDAEPATPTDRRELAVREMRS